MFRPLIVLALMAALGPVSFAQSGQVGGVGLTMFVDSNFRGEVQTFRTDVPNLRVVNMFQIASSLRVADGEQWEVCEEPNYGGACLVVSGAESDLRRRGWNDRIGSVRRVGGGGRFGRGGGGGFPQPGRRGLELYSEARFYGERHMITSAVDNLYQLGFNDRAMSLSVPEGDVWEVCIHAEFRDCRSFSASVTDLGEFGLARNISSARPIRLGRGGSGGSGGRIGRGNAPRLVLFDNRGFNGASRVIDADTPALFAFGNRAESLQVSGGVWEVCDRPKFSGKCVTVSSDVQDLRPMGLANQIQSVRLRSR